MDTRTAEPDIDRRELLEAEAAGVVRLAVDAVERAWRDRSADTAPSSADVDVLRRFADALLRAVLVDFVQSGLGVDRRAGLLRSAAVAAPLVDLSEYLRTVRVVGLDALVDHLERYAALTRAEHLRLRASAERVSGQIVGDDAIETPERIEVLRRLQSTGVDLR